MTFDVGSSMAIRAEAAIGECMEGWEWIEAIHEAILDTHDPDDFFELQRWWLETVQGVWADFVASRRTQGPGSK